MKLLDVCKSGFYYKIETKPTNVSKYTSYDFEEKMMTKISSLVLSPRCKTKGKLASMYVILKIEIPFLEAYKIADQIIRYSHTIPTLDFVQFKNVTRSDLSAICATKLNMYQSIPFEISEICYYPKTFCFETYITIYHPWYSSRFIIRDRWNNLFQQMFKTNRFNVIILEGDNENDKT